jgi:sigma-E factor negative regulatory protein RseA
MEIVGRTTDHESVESTMKQGPHDDADALERLSAMVDGEAESGAVERLCAAWREQPATRAWWHAYHLIGDVLRSEDLSSNAKHDAEFLRAVRERLAKEPAVIAPAAPAKVPAVRATENATDGERSSRWRNWSASVAVAAGFVAVAGVLLVTQVPAPTPAPVLAGANDAGGIRNASGPVPALAGAADAEPQSVVGSGKVIRDARLEHYLAAHKQFAGSSALGVPSGFLRGATAEVPGR